MKKNYVVTLEIKEQQYGCSRFFVYNICENYEDAEKIVKIVERMDNLGVFPYSGRAEIHSVPREE